MTDTRWRNRIVGHDDVDPASLTANPLNFRTHPKAQSAALGGALDELGWIDDVLVNRNGGRIIDGHLRVALALERKEPTVPVKYVDLDVAEEALALATFDPITAMATVDKQQLDALLREVSTGDAAVQAMLADLAKASGLDYGQPPAADDPGADLDRAEELRAKWGTERGQLWELGNHRLAIGDSTDWGTVGSLMGADRAQLCFTSPPYWVGKDYETQTSLQEVRDFVSASAGVMARAVTADGGRIVINTSTARAQAINPKAEVETLFALAWWQDALREADWLMRHCRLWVKRGQMAAPSVAARSDVIDQHWETVATFLPTFYNPDGLRRGQEKIGMKWAQQGVWDDIHGEANMDLHGAAFPVELPLRYLRLYTVGGETVFEPFCGTGTVMVACQQTDRPCRAVELDPTYAAVALERLSLMGLTPELAD